MPRKNITRRSMLKKAGLLSAGAATTFMGPWHFNRVYAAASDKAIVIGLTSDASGQYANSGASDRRGMLMAIAEVNERGRRTGTQGGDDTHRHRDHTGHRQPGWRNASSPATNAPS